jgi:hypothetical protein
MIEGSRREAQKHMDSTDPDSDSDPQHWYYVNIQDTVTCIPGAAAGSVATLPCMKYYGEKEFDTSRKYILAFSY